MSISATFSPLGDVVLSDSYLGPVDRETKTLGRLSPAEARVLADQLHNAASKAEECLEVKREERMKKLQQEIAQKQAELDRLKKPVNVPASNFVRGI